MKKQYQNIIFSLTVAFAIIGVISAWQNSEIVAKAYLADHLEQKLTDLGKENANLEKNLFKGEAMASLEKIAKDLNLEKINDISFIHLPENTIVAR